MSAESELSKKRKLYDTLESLDESTEEEADEGLLGSVYALKTKNRLEQSEQSIAVFAPVRKQAHLTVIAPVASQPSNAQVTPPQQINLGQAAAPPGTIPRPAELKRSNTLVGTGNDISKKRPRDTATQNILETANPDAVPGPRPLFYGLNFCMFMAIKMRSSLTVYQTSFRTMTFILADASASRRLRTLALRGKSISRDVSHISLSTGA